eukprot:Pgem_evm1s13994
MPRGVSRGKPPYEKFLSCPCPSCNFKEQKDDRTLLRHAIRSYYGPDRDKILIDKSAPDQKKERRRVLIYIKEHLRTQDFKKAREEGLVSGFYWLPDYFSLAKYLELSDRRGYSYNHYHDVMIKNHGKILQEHIQNSV